MIYYINIRCESVISCLKKIFTLLIILITSIKKGNKYPSRTCSLKKLYTIQFLIASSTASAEMSFSVM